MTLATLLFLIIAISLLFISLINLLKKDLISNDLLFFIFVSIILSITILIFYFYFQDIYISFMASFMMIINNFLLIREIKNIIHHYDLLTWPFFIFTTYIFAYLLLATLTF